MVSRGKLKTWQAAGLIDAATVARIEAWEAERARPLGLWALVTLGALAVGLGLVSVIAANWEAIPGHVRLALHAVLLLALAAWMVRRPPHAERDAAGDEEGARAIFDDAWLFIYAALALTFVGHVGQVYQTTSPLWQPLLFWLMLCGPLLIAFGRGWLAALAVVLGVIGTAIAHAGTHLMARADLPQLYVGVMMSVPVVLTGVAATGRRFSGRRWFWRALEYLSLMTVMAGGSLFVVAAGIGGSVDREWIAVGAIVAAIAWGVAGWVWWVHRNRSGRATAIMLSATALAVLLSTFNPGSAVLAALLFMGLWGALAWVALDAEWRGLFQLAVAMVALRLVILSFELATDLLGSGVGLILAGLATLGIAFGAVRFSRAWAPRREGAA